MQSSIVSRLKQHFWKILRKSHQMLPFFLGRVNILKVFCWFLPTPFLQHSPNRSRKSRYLPEIIFFLGTVSEGHFWLNRSWLRKLFSCSLPALSPCSSKLQSSWVFVNILPVSSFSVLSSSTWAWLRMCHLEPFKWIIISKSKRITNQALYYPKMKFSDVFHSPVALFPTPLPTSTRLMAD